MGQRHTQSPSPPTGPRQGPPTRSHPERGWASVRMLAALALVVVTGLGVHWGRGLLEGRQRAAHAAAFVERAESQVGELATLFDRPVHDVAADRRAIRDQLARIHDELELATRPRALPEARFHLGRLYLALGDVEIAWAHLRQARALGLEDPRLELALAQCTAELRDRAGILIGLLLPSPTRERLAALAHQHLGPSNSNQAHSNQHQSADPPSPLGEADSALEPRTRAPGEPLDREGAELDRTIEASPSDPRAYLAACAFWLARHDSLWLAGRGRTALAAELAEEAPNLPAARARAEVACSDGLRVDPESWPLHAAFAAVELRQPNTDPGILESLLPPLPPSPATPPGAEPLTVSARLARIVGLHLHASVVQRQGAARFDDASALFDDAARELRTLEQEARAPETAPSRRDAFALDRLALELERMRWDHQRDEADGVVTSIDSIADQLAELERWTGREGIPAEGEGPPREPTTEQQLERLERRIDLLRAATHSRAGAHARVP